MSVPLRLGRYSLFAQLASGGMATVYLGRLNGEAGFGRTVAIKRLHPHLAREPEFVTMFLDEAHLAARVRHPNVAPTLDIVTSDDELFLVMEYIQGESLGALLRATDEQGGTIPVPIVTSVVIGLLSGLQAAHEATDEEGRPLGIIHRDVSPQNVLVGTDGVARLVDFGVARASTRLAVTRDGRIKGKVPYMAPEQLSGIVSQQTDIYATGVVLWECLACRRLYRADSEGELFVKVLEADAKPPSRYNTQVTPELDAIVLRALAKGPEGRYASAREMAEALDATLRPASTMRVGEWVSTLAAPSLQKKAALVALAESGSEPHGDVFFLKGPGDLPRLETAKDLLSEPETSMPSLPSGLHTATVAFPLSRDLPPARRALAWLFVGLAALALSVVAVVLFGVGRPPSTANLDPRSSTANSALANASGQVPVSASASPAGAVAALGSALTPRGPLSPRDVANPHLPSSSSAGVARPVPAASTTGQKKIEKTATLPSARHPPPSPPADSAIQDLLDTR